MSLSGEVFVRLTTRKAFQWTSKIDIKLKSIKCAILYFNYRYSHHSDILRNTTIEMIFVDFPIIQMIPDTNNLYYNLYQLLLV